MTPVPSLDGTVFAYRQDGDLVWARHSGGRIRLGYLVGTRTGDELAFRETYVRVDGETATGRCETRLGCDGDGRIVLDERWAWESREAGARAASSNPRPAVDPHPPVPGVNNRSRRTCWCRGLTL